MRPVRNSDHSPNSMNSCTGFAANSSADARHFSRTCGGIRTNDKEMLAFLQKVHAHLKPGGKALLHGRATKLPQHMSSVLETAGRKLRGARCEVRYIAPEKPLGIILKK